MKKDREILELAAKAAGMETQWEQPRGAKSGWLRARVPGQMAFPVWRPLDDDGDALRLLSRLPFRELYVSEIGATVSCRREEWHGLKCDEYAEEHGGDLQAAIRRAIVRAAAAMGAPNRG